MSCNQSAPSQAAPSVRSASRQSLVHSASFGPASASLAASVRQSSPAQSFALPSGNCGAQRTASFSQQGQQGQGAYLSQVEQALLNAQNPLQFSESEEITVNGQRGVLLNRQEIAAFRGSRPIDSYPLNQDSNPQVIRKNGGTVEHVQQVNVRFLKPPSGQAGPIIIKQDPSSVVEPAPPVIIRQQPAKPQTPAPQVFREAPPKSVNLAPKVITIKGKSLPAPARKVIIEKLAALPAKPADITIDRWLAPEGVKRRVIFKPAPNQQQGSVKNVVIEWSPVQANVRQQLNVRGVTEQNPDEYSRQYGSQLVQASQLPAAGRNVQAPNGARLAADAGSEGGLVELEGDVQALALIDLEAEGLGEYRQYLNRLGVNANQAAQSQSSSFAQTGSAAYSPAPRFPTPAVRPSTPVSIRPATPRLATPAARPASNHGCGAPATPAPVNNCTC